MRNQKNNFRRTLLTGVACSAVTLTSGAFAPIALAQSAQDEIIVTARKRSESLVDVPVSISAVSGASLEENNVTSVTELFNLIPGVENNADGSRIANKPAIRGVGSQENAAIRAKVTSFIDGIPLLGAQGMATFAGLQQVEVLRGPQSSAFGRSTFGGAINYTTRDLGEEFEGNIRVGFGSDETRNLSGVVSVPIGENFGVIATLEERNYGGPDEWITTSGHQLGEQNSKLGSLKLAYDDGKFHAEALYMHQKIDDSQPPTQFASLAQLQAHPDNPAGNCRVDGAMNANCVIVGAIDTSLEPLVFDFDYDNAVNPILDPGTRIKRDRFQGELSYEFDSGYSITALGAHTEEVGDTWFDRDLFTQAAMQTQHVASTPELTEKYGELRLASPATDRLNWLIGASIYDYDYTNTVFDNRNTNSIMGFFSEGATNVGVFFNLGYDILDRLTASVEGRYQSDKINGTYPADAARNNPTDLAVEETTKSFQPRVSLRYDLNDHNNIYAQFARGSNPAGFNVIAFDPILNQTAMDEGFGLSNFTAFEEEVINSYEVGAKGLLDGKFRYAASIYYLDWKNYVQPSTADWTPSDGVLLPGTSSSDYFQRLFIGVGDLDGLGGEFEGTWDVSEKLVVGGTLAFNGVEFKENSCSAIPLDYGVPADQTMPFACASLDGKTPPMFSKVTTSFHATYTQPISEDLVGYGRATHNYRSKRYPEVTNTDYIKGFHTVNLSAGVRSDRWSAEIYVKNLLDDDTPSGAVRYFDGRIPGMSFNTSYQPRQPRQIGVNLGYDF